MSKKESKFEKDYNIIGKRLTPEKVAETSSYLAGRKEGAMTPLEGEYEKSEEEIKVIEFIGDCLNKETKELEIDKKIDFKPEQFHFLPTDIYNRRYGAAYPASANFFQLNQCVYMDKDAAKTRLSLYNAIFHEAVHMASFMRFKRIKPRDSKPLECRCGYGLHDENNQLKLSGFDEIITEEIKYEIINKNIDKLKKKFNITEWELEEKFGRYPSDLLPLIINKIAEHKNEDYGKVWKRLKQGYFGGEMMHLRDVAKVFGEDALKVLAVLDYRHDPDFSTHKKVLTYFNSDNKEEREKIAGEILKENVPH